MNKRLVRLLVVACVAACGGCRSGRVADRSQTHYSVQTMRVSAQPVQVDPAHPGGDLQLPDGAHRVRYPTVFLMPGETREASNSRSCRAPVGFVNGEVTEFQNIQVGQVVRATLNLQDNGEPDLSYFLADSALLRHDTHVTPSGKKVRVPIVTRWTMERSIALFWDKWAVLGSSSGLAGTETYSILVRVCKPVKEPSNQ